MKEALRQAEKAFKLGEVPIGCVIVDSETGRIVGRGYNRRNTDKTTTSHAEISAIKKASKKLGDWRLEGCTIYISLEPCPMCAGAIVQARLDRCVYAAASDKAGCAGTVLNILQQDGFNHKVDITGGVLEEEAKAILQRFFKELRISLRQP
ncbi:MAG: nucleoside deaminase [Lachnospiraceae bacterium]|nr:nucleoside deaminase [Lachnospiraceae bacterium]